MKKSEVWILFLGFWFSAVGIIAFYSGVQNFGISGILWFSYFALFLIGVGMIFRNSFLISSQLNIILLPYIVWNIDFFYALIFSGSLFGVTDYFFTSRSFLEQIITIQHIFIIPASLAVLYFIGMKRNDSWKLGVFQVFAVFFVLQILHPAKNINCVFENCLGFQIPLVPYSVLWLAVYPVMIILTNLLLSKMFFRK